MSGINAADADTQIRRFTQGIEFDYAAWMLGAMGTKLGEAIGSTVAQRTKLSPAAIVDNYIQGTGQLLEDQAKLERIYADPAITNKQSAAMQVQSKIAALLPQQNALEPVAEGVLQEQVAQAAGDLNLRMLNWVFPPVLYRTTSVPDALIVSPRTRIQQDANISITAGLPVDRQQQLESEVEATLDVSALVVPIGGVGVYPTMIMRTTDLPWLLGTIAHEWTHNYLELRPLGWLYDSTPELRTMNETTAEIVGSEIKAQVLRRFYPSLAAPASSPAGSAASSSPSPKPEPPAFDFRAEMHTTRVTVDSMLADGKVAEAEQYMETRRQLFVRHGYYIRRLNQAYFAFYGAYAEESGGAAGEDPVGPAVRKLRAQSPTLADFLNRISWMTSFSQLQQALQN